MRYQLSTIYLALSTLCLFTGRANAQGWQDILRQIEQNNITLKAMQSEIQADVADSRQRNQPSALEVEYSPFFRRGTGLNNSEMIVRQSFDTPMQYRRRNRTTRQVEATSQAQYRIERRNILWQAQQLCIDLVVVNKNRHLMLERLRISQELDTLYRKRLEAGDATALDVNKIQLECMDRRTELNKNEAERQLLLMQLQTLNGGLPVCADSLTYPADHIHLAVEELIEQRQQNDAELLALSQEEKLAESHLGEARQSWLPSLSVGYRRNTERRHPVHGFMVGASFPMWSTRQGVRAAEQRLEATRQRKQQADIEMQNEIRASAYNFQQYLNSLKSYDLALLRTSLSLLRTAVEAGEVSVIEYYTEAEHIYQQLQTYYALEHDCQKIHAEIHRNEL